MSNAREHDDMITHTESKKHINFSLRNHQKLDLELDKSNVKNKIC